MPHEHRAVQKSQQPYQQPDYRSVEFRPKKLREYSAGRLKHLLVVITRTFPSSADREVRVLAAEFYTSY